MNISNLNLHNIRNSVYFGKSLVASCKLPRKSGIPLPCKIYEINTTEDRDYFVKLTQKDIWRGGSYVWEMDDEFNSEVWGQKTYVMENKSGKCLGYIAVGTDFDDLNKDGIAYLETCPKYKSANSKRTIKYIGETLLAFAVKIAQKNNMETVRIPVWASTAEDFYKENCGFKEDEYGLYLNSSEFQTFLSKNEAHTKSEILL